MSDEVHTMKANLQEIGGLFRSAKTYKQPAQHYRHRLICECGEEFFFLKAGEGDFVGVMNEDGQHLHACRNGHLIFSTRTYPLSTYEWLNNGRPPEDFRIKEV